MACVQKVEEGARDFSVKKEGGSRGIPQQTVRASLHVEPTRSTKFLLLRSPKKVQE